MPTNTEEPTMLILLAVKVHNNPEQDCRRLSLTRTYKYEPTDEFDTPVSFEDFVRDSIRATEALHREAFPRNMSYVTPYTEVEIIDDAIEVTLDDIAEAHAR